MGRTSYAGVAIFLLSFCFCHNSALDIPSQKDFLCSIFNATEKELAVIVAKFSLTGHVSLNEIKIIQYTADGGNYSATLSDPEGLKAINLDSDQKIVIITHGFWSSGTTDWVVNMATAYHGIGIRNTLAVDWAEPASTINYVGSARATLNVGRLVAEWLVSYLENNATLIQNLHLVGHSLGAHISAFIGQTIYNLTDVKVGRISGLDFAVRSQLPCSSIRRNCPHLCDLVQMMRKKWKHITRTNICLVSRRQLPNKIFWLIMEVPSNLHVNPKAIS
uniref:Lipase domain-containing protein n=1 Tax=Dendroctonus ponderosae TaxID=77166 RepID=A0AAR5NZK7_DENPD